MERIIAKIQETEEARGREDLTYIG